MSVLKARYLHIAAGCLAASFILAATGILYRSEKARIIQTERLSILHQISALGARLEKELNTRIDISHAVAAHVAVNSEIDREEFRIIADELTHLHTGIRSIQLARGSVVTHVYPFNGNEAALGPRLTELPGQAEAVAREIRNRETVLAGPVDLIQGGAAFISRTPIYASSRNSRTSPARYWGLATVVIDRDTIYRESGLDRIAWEMQLALRGADGLGSRGKIFFGDSRILDLDPVVSAVNFKNGAWDIIALPKAGWAAPGNDLLWLPAAGVLLSLTVGGLALVMVRRSQHQRTLLGQYRQVEQSLRDSEAKYRAVVDHANEGIAVARDGVFCFVNPKLVTLLGYSREELLSGPFARFVHPADRDMVMSRHAMRLRGEPLPQVYSFRALDREGNVKWLEINAVVMTWEGLPAALVFLNDITERKQTEDALQQALDELERKVRERTAALTEANSQLISTERTFRTISLERQALLEAIGDSLMHLDPGCTVLWANKAAAAAVGREMPDLIGRRCPELWQNRPLPCAECPVAESFRTALPAHGHVATSDGRHWGVKAFPLTSEEGKVVSVIEIAADITDRIKFQVAAARTKQMVSLGELAAGVAHEINNPLAGTYLCFKELMQPDLDGPARESLARAIDGELTKMQKVVGQLLNFSRMTVTRKSPVDVTRIVESIIVLCRYQFQTRNILLETGLCENLPPVLGEEGKLEQVFLNIMLNALHAMEQGGVLTISTGRNRTYCVIHFCDTGPGIPADVLPKIFEPFFTTRAGEGGTGLGLSISREIVEQHGGVIEAASTPGKGARFTVSLPLAPPEAEQKEEP